MAEKKFNWRPIVIGLLALLLAGIGFFVGRKTVKIPSPNEVIKYIELPPIHDSIPKPVPYFVTEPVDTLDIIKQCIADGIYAELWPTKVDTVKVPTTADTTAILADWATKRFYSTTLFSSDTLGTCIVDTEIQYNRMKYMKYEYKPKQKEVSTESYQIKAFSPFIGITGTCPTDGRRDFLIGATAGAYIKEKFGIQASYQHSVYDNTAYVSGGFLYKF